MSPVDPHPESLSPGEGLSCICWRGLASVKAILSQSVIFALRSSRTRRCASLQKFPGRDIQLDVRHKNAN